MSSSATQWNAGVNETSRPGSSAVQGAYTPPSRLRSMPTSPAYAAGAAGSPVTSRGS